MKKPALVPPKSKIIEIYMVPQGSPEWHQLRCGVPTASMFGTIMAQGKSGEASATRKKYMLRLATERINGKPEPSEFSNVHTDRGVEMEAEARDAYVFSSGHDEDVRQVGFIRNGKFGCSPDGLIGTSGLVQLKTAQPTVLKPMLARYTASPKNFFPMEHKPQCQGELMVTEREWIELFVFWPKETPLLVRAYRDEQYIRSMREQCELFELELRKMIEKMKDA